MPPRVRKKKPKSNLEYPLVNQETFQAIQFILTPRVIMGALRSALHAHGPVSGNVIWLTEGKLLILYKEKDEWRAQELETCSASSAAKRIRGALKTRVEEYLKRQSEKKIGKDGLNVVEYGTIEEQASLPDR